MLISMATVQVKPSQLHRSTTPNRTEMIIFFLWILQIQQDEHFFCDFLDKSNIRVNFRTQRQLDLA